MREIKIAEEETLTVPGGSTSVVITHEWGGSTTATSLSSEYDWTPTSIGVHKLQWKTGSTVNATEFINVFMPIIDRDSFISDYPMYSSLTDNEFDRIERTARLIIQNYTGQRFGPYVGQTLEVQGDGGDSLELPAPALALTSVQNTYGEDMTDMVEVSPGYTTFIQRASRFNGNSQDIKRDIFMSGRDFFSANQTFLVEGSFGWEYVPVEVSTAAAILLNAEFGSGDITEMRKSGVLAAQIGDFSMKLNADQWGTTGNTQADNLLSAYVNLGIGMV